PSSAASALLNGDIPFCHNAFQLSLGLCGHILGILSAWDQESVQVVGGDRRIRTSSGYAAFEMGTVLIVGISEPGRGDGDGSRFAVFSHLNQHSGNRLPAPFGHNGAVVAVA